MITTTNKIINVCLYVSLLTFFVIAIGSCGKKEKAKDDAEKENIEAKKMLSGIWMDADEESVIFKAAGD